MGKTLLLACTLWTLTSTVALAENWVPAGTYSAYDADSAYVDAQTGLLYVSICPTSKCTPGDPVNPVNRSRYDCDALTSSHYSDGWSAPAKEGDGVYDYSPQSADADIIALLCRQKASLPRR
jgi:hypothetical protein